jgi:hypothetical protein
MMKSAQIFILVLAQTLLSAGEVPEIKSAQPQAASASTDAPRAWLGLRVAKPDKMTAAQVPSLPPGIGFVVKSLDAGGPAQCAGLLEFDLLWKIGDQMLINEAQLATLLRLSQPGEEIVISGFRGGKSLAVKLKLGEAPLLKKPFSGEMVVSAILPGAFDGPMRVVNVAEKSASFSADEGKAVVRRDGEIYKVKIDGPHDTLIYEGKFSKNESLDKLPECWRRRIQVLCRSLDQALDGGMPPPRQPQPRVVPQQSEKP